MEWSFWKRSGWTLAVAILLVAGASQLLPQGRGPAAPKQPAGPWMDRNLPADKRAEMVLAQMTLDEKIQLVHGAGGFGFALGQGEPSRSLGGAGWIPGIPRLGIPDLNFADCAVGVTRGGPRSRYATALPSTIAVAASWDPKIAYLHGTVIGRELRDHGFNVSLGGGVNLIREPRCGRNFEYFSEDPILAGKMVAQVVKAIQDNKVVGHVKHYALNHQETGRNIANVVMSKRVMRETELLSFEIAVREAQPWVVMCAYNKVNGDWSCENDYLLNQVLKKAWGFRGWVISDWGATHSTVKAALNGLDQEMPGGTYFGEALKKAVEAGEVPMERLNDMVRRILRALFASGVIDEPPSPKVVDVFQGLEDAQQIAEQSIVLLKNANNLLPLQAGNLKSIAVIGGHADVGVLSGGGSAQVDPAGGNAVPPPPEVLGRGFMAMWTVPVYHRSSPLKAIRAKARTAKVEFNDGKDPDAAARLAKAADVAVVFAVQHTREGADVPNLSLPDKQDDLIRAVARANPRTIVVLQTGGPVTMPWVNEVGSILEAWYPGIRGGEAIANVLFGDVNPSGKLPVTFPRSEQDLPQPVLPGSDQLAASKGGAEASGPFGPSLKPFDITYPEGLKVGYKWFDAEKKEPLFPFGHGLSYTTYAYSGLKASVSGNKVTVTFTVQNTGKRAGAEIAQVYAELPAEAGEPPKRLVAWEKIPLKPGEARTVTLTIDPLHLCIFNEQRDNWELPKGNYQLLVGRSSRDLPLRTTVTLNASY